MVDSKDNKFEDNQKDETVEEADILIVEEADILIVEEADSDFQKTTHFEKPGCKQNIGKKDDEEQNLVEAANKQFQTDLFLTEFQAWEQQHGLKLESLSEEARGQKSFKLEEFAASYLKIKDAEAEYNHHLFSSLNNSLERVEKYLNQTLKMPLEAEKAEIKAKIIQNLLQALPKLYCSLSLESINQWWEKGLEQLLRAETKELENCIGYFNLKDNLHNQEEVLIKYLRQEKDQEHKKRGLAEESLVKQAKEFRRKKTNALFTSLSMLVIGLGAGTIISLNLPDSKLDYAEQLMKKRVEVSSLRAEDSRQKRELADKQIRIKKQAETNSHLESRLARCNEEGAKKSYNPQEFFYPRPAPISISKPQKCPAASFKEKKQQQQIASLQLQLDWQRDYLIYLYNSFSGEEPSYWRARAREAESRFSPLVLAHQQKEKEFWGLIKNYQRVADEHNSERKRWEKERRDSEGDNQKREAEYQADISRLGEENAKLESRFEEKEDQLKNLISDYQKLKAELEKKRRGLVGKEEKRDYQIKIAGMEGRIRELNNRCFKEKAQTASLNQTTTNLKKELDNYSRERVLQAIGNQDLPYIQEETLRLSRKARREGKWLDFGIPEKLCYHLTRQTCNSNMLAFTRTNYKKIKEYVIQHSRR